MSDIDKHTSRPVTAVKSVAVQTSNSLYLKLSDVKIYTLLSSAIATGTGNVNPKVPDTAVKSVVVQTSNSLYVKLSDVKMLTLLSSAIATGTGNVKIAKTLC